MFNLPGYRMIREIARTNMSIVYHAEQINLNREVALKLLHSHHTTNQERRQRFLNEARLMSKLIHPNIVQLFNLLEQDNIMILVLEYVEGKDLDKIIGKDIGPMPYETALPIFMQILQGVGHAHDGGIVHRDIKPGNVMVSNRHIAKVNDFGVAKLIGQEGLTKVGTQVGTVFYMSPEQVMGSDVGHTSDIYSLGVTLYEMLAGRLPYDDHTTNEFEIQKSIIRSDLPDPRNYYPHIPKWLVKTLNKALQKRPEKRFNSCNEFLYELKRGMQSGTSPKPSSKISIFGRMNKAMSGIFNGNSVKNPEPAAESLSYEAVENRETRKKKQLEELLSRRAPVSSSEEQQSPHQMTKLIDEDEERRLAHERLSQDYDAIINRHSDDEDLLDDDSLAGKQIEEDLAEKEDTVAGKYAEKDAESETNSDELDFWTLKKKALFLVAGLLLIISVVFVSGLFKGPDPDNEGSVPAIVTYDTLPPQLIASAVVPYSSGYSVGESNHVALTEDGTILCSDGSQLLVLSKDSPQDINFTLDTISTSEYDIDLINDIAAMPDGNILVSDAMECKTVLLDANKNLILQIEDFNLLAPTDLYGLSPVAFCGYSAFYTDGMIGYDIGQWTAEPDADVIYMTQQYDNESLTTAEFYSLFLFPPQCAASSNGRVFVSAHSTESYSIDIYSQNGTFLNTIEFEFTPVAKTVSEIQKEAEWFHEASEEPASDWIAEPNRPAIADLGVDPSGRLWAKRGTTDGLVFDVFSQDGEFLLTISPDSSYPEDIKIGITEFGFIGYSDSESKFYIIDFYLERIIEVLENESNR